jgi:hypothetical protein
MTFSAQPKAFLADFSRSRVLRWSMPVAVVAAIAVAPGAEARTLASRGYDGTWNVTFATKAGNCSATNSVPFAVSGRRVSSAGGGKVTGGIGRGGAVAVRISVGLSWATGSGRLAGNSGAGRWAGVISGDRCSGNWQAARS